MRIVETPVNGIWELKADPLVDDRGWFARLIDMDEISARALPFTIVQANASFNAHRDTVRGMHYQEAPHGEAKIVRCTSGAIFDVGVDIDPTSSTYLQWYGRELSSANHGALLLGPKIAHGFQTLTDSTEVHYLMGTPYVADAQRGLRWDDPRLGIDWPAPITKRILSDRDLGFSLLPT